MGRKPKPEIPAKILTSLTNSGPASLSQIHRNISLEYGQKAAGSVQSYYNVVGELQSKGLINAFVEPPTSVRGGRERIVYSVTTTGIEISPRSMEDALNAKTLGWSICCFAEFQTS